ncbi:MAG: SRPBCC family protein [Acidobacteria bacterium]|nr:SRPBCC family protein [Acidobacteriota bacterium]
MLKKILLGLVAVLVVLAAAVAMQPAQFEVTRKARIPAPPDKVFGMVNDFHKWSAWSPWEKLDPAMKRSYSGAESGMGAIYGWVGNSDVGEGRMTITESTPSQLVRIKLDFIKPFEASNNTEFHFAPADNQTEVTWRMTGENNFISKAFCLVMGGMDKMIGPDFEKGLAQMQAAAAQ